MGNCIHRAVIWLARLICPAPTGRHRAAQRPKTHHAPDTPTQPLPVIRPTRRCARNTEPLPAESVADVRPYLLAHERHVRHQDERLTNAVRACVQRDLAEAMSW